MTFLCLAANFRPSSGAQAVSHFKQPQALFVFLKFGTNSLSVRCWLEGRSLRHYSELVKKKSATSLQNEKKEAHRFY